MTKCIIIGETIQEEKKKIEFVFALDFNGDQSKASNPDQWETIELICKRDSGMDVMFAYDFNRAIGHIFLGHWNDGVV